MTTAKKPTKPRLACLKVVALPEEQVQEEGTGGKDVSSEPPRCASAASAAGALPPHQYSSSAVLVAAPGGATFPAFAVVNGSVVGVDGVAPADE